MPSRGLFFVCNVKLIRAGKIYLLCHASEKSRSDPGGHRITDRCDCGEEEREEEEEEEKGDRRGEGWRKGKGGKREGCERRGRGRIGEKGKE